MTFMAYKEIKRHILDKTEYTPSYVSELIAFIDKGKDEGTISFEDDGIEATKSPEKVSAPFKGPSVTGNH